jgi:hypothetical protein
VQSLHPETIHLGLDVHKHSICVGQVVKATRTGLAGASVHHGEAVASRIVAVTASGSDTLSACDGDDQVLVAEDEPRRDVLPCWGVGGQWFGEDGFGTGTVR